MRKGGLRSNQASRWLTRLAAAAALSAAILLFSAAPLGVVSAQSATETDLQCPCFYDIQGGFVTLNATRVTFTGTGRTGALKLALWATTAPYTGGDINGYQLAEAGLGELGSNQYFGSPSRTVAYAAPPDGTYYITMLVTEYFDGADLIVDHESFDHTHTLGSGTGDVTGSGTFASRPAISGASGRATGSNAGAAKEFGEPDHAGNAGGASLWWSWTAPATGTATFDTRGSDFDTLLAIYTGNSIGALAVVASNDDALGGGILQSEASFIAQQGVVYHIAVDGYNGRTGSVVLGWTQAGVPDPGPGPVCDPSLACGTAITCVDGLEYPTTCGPSNCDTPLGPCVTAGPEPGPGGDAFTARSAISGASGQATGSSVGATKELGEPDHHGNAGGASLWWSWMAPATGMVTIDTEGSDFDTLLAVYTGGSVGALTTVASNDDAIGRLSRVTFTAQRGVVYHIVVDGYSGRSGSIVLNWSQDADPGTGPGPTCDPNLVCGTAITCVDGLEYPTTCGPNNCDLPLGPCDTVGPGPEPGPGSDGFLARSAISGISGRATGSNVGATKESGEPDHAGNAGGASLWWSWTAPATGMVTFDTRGSDFDTLLAVYTGGSVGALAVVASNDDAPDSGVLQSEASFTARQGVVYHIAVDGYSGRSGSIVLNWSQAVDPGPGPGPGPTCDPNLLCGTAITCVNGLEYPTTCGPSNCDMPLGPCDTVGPGAEPGPGSDGFIARSAISGASGLATGSNVGATKESGEPDHHGNAGGASVWWSWTAPATGEVTFDTEGSDFDTLLAVYTGGSVGALSLVASDDDIDTGNRQSEVTFTAQQGVMYHIVVDGFGNATGSIVLNWSQDGGPGPGPGPGGDNFTAKSTISGASGQTTGSNVGATKESGEPDHHGNAGGASVWWSWTAPATGQVTFDTEGSDFDTLLAVYTGGSVGALTLVASNDDIDTGNRQSEVTFTAQQGVVYHIVVDGFGGATGSIVLNWSQESTQSTQEPDPGPGPGVSDPGISIESICISGRTIRHPLADGHAAVGYEITRIAAAPNVAGLQRGSTRHGQRNSNGEYHGMTVQAFPGGGTNVQYYDNGTLLEECAYGSSGQPRGVFYTFTDGVLHGVRHQFYIGGSWDFQTYRAGVLDGPSGGYLSNGRPDGPFTVYVDGEEDGVSYTFFRGGSWEFKTYATGTLHGPYGAYNAQWQKDGCFGSFADGTESPVEVCYSDGALR